MKQYCLTSVSRRVVEASLVGERLTQACLSPGQFLLASCSIYQDGIISRSPYGVVGVIEVVRSNNSQLIGSNGVLSATVRFFEERQQIQGFV